MTAPKRLQTACWTFLIVGMILKAGAMLFFPPHYDTNYYLNIGSNFIERGGLTPYMWRLPETSNIIAGSGTGYGILPQAIWLQVFGLSLLAGRVYSYLLTLGMLGVVFMTARLWFGAPAAWYALLFGGVSSIVFANFTLRMDAAGTFVYALALWVHIYAVYQRGGIWHFLAGVAAILTTEMHILGLIFTASVSFYYGVEYLRACWQERRIRLRHPAIYFFCGTLIAGLVYLVIHVLPNPEAYFLIPNACEYCEPRGVLKEIGRVVNFLARYPIEAILLPLVTFAAFRRGRPQDHHLGLLLMGWWLGIIVISPPNQSDYSTHILPLLLIGIGAWAAFGRQTAFSMRQQRAANLLATAMLAVNLAFIGYWLFNPPPQDNRIAFVKQYVPTDQVVMGNNLLFHQLLDYPLFLSYGDDERYTVLLNKETFTDFWEREKPAVFLPHLPTDSNYVDWQADEEWVRYMTTHDFQEAYEGVWIALELYQTLTDAIAAEE